VGSNVQTVPEQADIASQQARSELQQKLVEATERLGLSNRATEFEGAPHLETDLEIAELREMVSRHEQVMLRATSAAQDAQKRLKESQIEVAKLQAQLKGALAAADAAKSALQPDELVRIQLARVQKDLQRERAIRQVETEQTTAKVAKLETALAEAREELEARKSRAAHPKLLIGAAALVSLLVLAALAVLVWRQSGPRVAAEAALPGRTGGESSSAEGSSGEIPLPVRRRAGKQSPAGPSSSNEPTFTKSLDRLTHALSAFPGQDPQAVLLAVSLKQSSADNKVCSFAWNDGQPSLLLGSGKSKGDSLSSALSQCADAVEHFR
jgi:hypothetical protein